jgi:tetratricopeptide (TPR) repeat protein
MRKPGRMAWAWHDAIVLTIVLTALGAVIGVWVKGVLGAGIGAGIGAIAGWSSPLLIARAQRLEEAWATVRRTEKGARRYGPAHVLDPALGVVPFTGRAAELSALEAWCDDERSGVLRLVTGSGGSGKTRLAFELMRHMRERGWRCVQVAEGIEKVALERQRAAAPRARLLLVVDYAEARAGLEELLESAARDMARVRVLLLARHAGDWWQRLQAGSGLVRDTVRDASLSVTELNAQLDAELSTVEVVRQAIPYFARRLGIPVPDTEAVSINGEGKLRVLDLHAAALVAVLSAADRVDGEQIRVNVDMVLEELLGHEKHYWRGRAEAAGLLGGNNGLSMAQLSQLVAAACLLGISTAAELDARVPGAGITESVTLWLRELYPPEHDGELGVLHPDRLAELHVSRELGASPALASACLTNLDPGQARRALLLLARASADYSAARSLLESSVERFSDVIEGITAPREVLLSIAGAIPLPSLTLGKAHASIIQRIVETYTSGSAERAQLLNILSILLRDLGQREAALGAVNEAVTIYRKLPNPQSDSFLVDLVAALNNQSNCLADLARPSDALAAIEEAVTACQTLIAARPDNFRPDLAMTLNNQSLRLAGLGRPEEAMVAIEKAATLYRQLVGARPNIYVPDLAMAVNNQSLRLADLGRREEALTAMKEAVTIYRQLANAWPDAYLPNIAGALYNQSALLTKFDRQAEALAVLEEAILIYRRLAEAIPEAYLHNLAGMLENRSAIQAKSGRREEAIKTIREAVAMYRSLPDAYLPDRLTALKQLLMALSGMQRWEEGSIAMEEAVAVSRKLATVQPGAYLPEFAKTLSLQADLLLTMLGQREKALKPIEEAIVVYRTLADTQPDPFLCNLAVTLDKQSSCLASLGRMGEALVAIEEAIVITRKLVKTLPEAFLPNLAALAGNQSVCLENLGRMKEALAAIEEAATIYGALANDQPKKFATIYERTLEVQVRILVTLNRDVQAKAIRAKAASIRKRA